MQLERILAWLPLATLLAMMLVGRLRALVMRRRGVRAIIVDFQRPTRERLYDTLMIAVAVFWIYLLVAGAWPLSVMWLPRWLSIPIDTSFKWKILGAGLIALAPVLYAWALWTMGNSWRIGIDQKKPGPLVTTGLFAWTRNPIYTAVGLLVIGSVLIHNRVIDLVVGVLMLLLVHGIIRREERFLAARYGDSFQSYRQRVGRYSPWL